MSKSSFQPQSLQLLRNNAVSCYEGPGRDTFASMNGIIQSPHKHPFAGECSQCEIACQDVLDSMRTHCKSLRKNERSLSSRSRLISEDPILPFDANSDQSTNRQFKSCNDSRRTCTNQFECEARSHTSLYPGYQINTRPHLTSNITFTNPKCEISFACLNFFLYAITLNKKTWLFHHLIRLRLWNNQQKRYTFHSRRKRMRQASCAWTTPWSAACWKWWIATAIFTSIPTPCDEHAD
jgi:hypothetical protein